MLVNTNFHGRIWSIFLLYTLGVYVECVSYVLDAACISLVQWLLSCKNDRLHLPNEAHTRYVTYPSILVCMQSVHLVPPIPKHEVL